MERTVGLDGHESAVAKCYATGIQAASVGLARPFKPVIGGKNYPRSHYNKGAVCVNFVMEVVFSA